MRAIWVLAIMFLGFSAGAQEITGNVVDSKKEPVVSGAVYVTQGGITKGGCTLDYDGNYVIKPLDPGCYDATLICTGYDTLVMNDVIVEPGQRTTVNFKQGPAKPVRATIVRTYRKPLVMSEPGQSVLPADAEKMPATEITDLVALLAPSAYQAPRGGGINIGGARTERTTYIIDGLRVVPTVEIETIICLKPVVFGPLDRTSIGHHMPYTDICDIVATMQGVYQARRGDELHVYGSR